VTQPVQPFLTQIERAWHRLMHAMAVVNANRVNSGRIVLKVLHGEMKRH
jgi:hypothetical protein